MIYKKKIFLIFFMHNFNLTHIYRLSNQERKKGFQKLFIGDQDTPSNIISHYNILWPIL